MHNPRRRIMARDGMLSIPVDIAVFGINLYASDYIAVAQVGGALYELETFKTKQEAVEYLEEIHMRFEF